MSKFIFMMPVKICSMNLRMFGMSLRLNDEFIRIDSHVPFPHSFVRRSHLREIRDRSVLRLFESNEVTAPQVLPGGPGVPQPLPSNGGHWDQDQVATIFFSYTKFILSIR